jgi:hypothetical protein
MLKSLGYIHLWTLSRSLVFLVLDAESAFVGIDEIPLAIRWNANIFDVLKYCLDCEIWTECIL